VKRAVTPSPPGEPAIGAIKALYTVQELADLARTTRFRMMRILDTHGIALVRSGRSILVPIHEIEWRVPQLLDAIEAAARVELRVRRK
jgi:hypothetical protein